MLAGLRACLSDSDISPSNDPADGSDAQLHIDLVRIGADLGHALAAGNTARQHLGSLSATHNSSTVAGYRFISADIEFTAQPSQIKQFTANPPIDADRSTSVNDVSWHDLQRRQVAMRERHVRTHHDAVGANDVGEVAQLRASCTMVS